MLLNFYIYLGRLLLEKKCVCGSEFRAKNKLRKLKLELIHNLSMNTTELNNFNSNLVYVLAN